MTAPNTLHTPTKPTERGASTSGSQRDRRWTDTFFDDYRHPRFPNGRPFTGEREYKSGVSEQSVTAGFLTSDLQCGEYFCENPVMGQTPLERQMTLDSAWSAPFLLPGGKKYMNFNYAKKRIAWRYDAFIADEKAELGKYWLAAAKMAGEGDVIEPTRPDAVPFRIRAVMGSPRVYLNKIRLAQACQAGDPWIMGAVDTPNEELAKILGLGEVQYLGGLNLGDAAYVSVPTPRAAEPLAKPDEVLSVSMDKVQEMIQAALAADAERRRAATAKARAGKKAKASAGSSAS